MEDDTVDGQQPPPLTDVLKETAVLPFRVLLSKQAIRTYLSSILVIFAGLSLYAISVVAYGYFYYNYIPDLSFTAPVHLQFDHSTNDPYTHEPSYHPHGVSSLTYPSGSSSAFVSQQPYDVSVKLSLPRSTANIHAGNFMVSLSMLGPSSRIIMPPYAATSQLLIQKPNATILATSSRPTTLTYVSKPVEIARKVLHLPSYILGWRHETETLVVKMMEGISFERGWRNVPSGVWVEVRSTQRLQIYDCEVKIKATLGGIRWLMNNHRIFSFVAFTSLFWTLEISTALFFWLVASFALSSARPTEKKFIEPEGSSSKRIKREEVEADDADNMSDTDRTFPTYGGQPPLRYESPQAPDFKVEEEQQGGNNRQPGADADISASDPPDEDADFMLDDLPQLSRRDYDSGLGTSMDSGAGSSGISRRRKGGK